MANIKPRTAIQELQWAEYRFQGIVTTVIELRDKLHPEELQAILFNVNAALKRIKDLKAAPKPRIAKRWSECK